MDSSGSDNIQLTKHLSNLLSAKDPMAFQAIAVENPTIYSADYDPSDEAEINRLRERGLSDGAILDEWSGQDAAEFAAVRSELFGETGSYD